MKYLTLGGICLAIGAMAATPVDLNALIDERIELNKEYKQEFVEAARESDYPERAAKYEAGVADEWLALLAYAQKSNDENLKRMILRLEYYDELRVYLTDMEFAENKEERLEAEAALDEYERKLQAVLTAEKK